MATKIRDYLKVVWGMIRRFLPTITGWIALMIKRFLFVIIGLIALVCIYFVFAHFAPNNQNTSMADKVSFLPFMVGLIILALIILSVRSLKSKWIIRGSVWAGIWKTIRMGRRRWVYIRKLMPPIKIGMGKVIGTVFLLLLALIFVIQAFSYRPFTEFVGSITKLMATYVAIPIIILGLITTLWAATFTRKKAPWWVWLAWIAGAITLIVAIIFLFDLFRQGVIVLPKIPSIHFEGIPSASPSQSPGTVMPNGTGGIKIPQITMPSGLQQTWDSFVVWAYHPNNGLIAGLIALVIAILLLAFIFLLLKNFAKIKFSHFITVVILAFLLMEYLHFKKEWDIPNARPTRAAQYEDYLRYQEVVVREDTFTKVPWYRKDLNTRKFVELDHEPVYASVTDPNVPEAKSTDWILIKDYQDLGKLPEINVSKPMWFKLVPKDPNKIDETKVRTYHFKYYYELKP